MREIKNGLHPRQEISRPKAYHYAIFSILAEN